MLTGAATIGLAVGSLFGGNMIRNGRHRALLVGNCAAVLGSLMSIYAQFHVICVGRFIVGLSAGILMAASPKVIEETIPSHLMCYGYGISTNIAQNFATLLDSVLALAIPNGLYNLH